MLKPSVGFKRWFVLFWYSWAFGVCVGSGVEETRERVRVFPRNTVWIFSIHKCSRQTPLHCQWPLVYPLRHAGECKGVCLFGPLLSWKCFYFFRFRQRMIITWLRRWTSKQPISGTRIRCIRVQNRPNCNWQIWRSFSGATTKLCCDSIDLFFWILYSCSWVCSLGGGGVLV